MKVNEKQPKNKLRIPWNHWANKPGNWGVLWCPMAGFEGDILTRLEVFRGKLSRLRARKSRWLQRPRFTFFIFSVKHFFWHDIPSSSVVLPVLQAACRGCPSPRKCPHPTRRGANRPRPSSCWASSGPSSAPRSSRPSCWRGPAAPARSPRASASPALDPTTPWPGTPVSTPRAPLGTGMCWGIHLEGVLMELSLSVDNREKKSSREGHNRVKSYSRSPSFGFSWMLMIRVLSVSFLPGLLIFPRK